MEGWGFANVQLAQWGPFGRGWENERLSINMIAERADRLVAILVITGLADIEPVELAIEEGREQPERAAHACPVSGATLFPRWRVHRALHARAGQPGKR